MISCASTASLTAHPGSFKCKHPRYLHSSCTATNSGKLHRTSSISISYGKSRFEKPGVSAIKPSASGINVTCRVVCRPRPSDFEIALVSKSSVGSSAFKNFSQHRIVRQEHSFSRPVTDGLAQHPTTSHWMSR